MRFDYPLTLINSKLPKKQPLYYQKWLIGLFAGSIGCLFILLLADATEKAINLIFGTFVASMFVVLFLFCLSKLYNDESDGRDFIIPFIPSVTASSGFNSVYGWLKRFNRCFLVVFLYVQLMSVTLIIVSLIYASGAF